MFPGLLYILETPTARSPFYIVLKAILNLKTIHFAADQTLNVVATLVFFCSLFSPVDPASNTFSVFRVSPVWMEELRRHPWTAALSIH